MVGINHKICRQHVLFFSQEKLLEMSALGFLQFQYYIFKKIFLYVSADHMKLFFLEQNFFGTTGTGLYR